MRIASILWAVIVWILFACLRSSSWLRVFRPPRGKAARDGVAPAIILQCSSQRKRNKIALLAGVFAPDVKQPVYHLARERRERGQRGRGRKGVARKDSCIDPRVCVCVRPLRATDLRVHHRHHHDTARNPSPSPLFSLGVVGRPSTGMSRVSGQSILLLLCKRRWCTWD